MESNGTIAELHHFEFAVKDTQERMGMGIYTACWQQRTICCVMLLELLIRYCLLEQRAVSYPARYFRAALRLVVTTETAVAAPVLWASEMFDSTAKEGFAGRASK